MLRAATTTVEQTVTIVTRCRVQLILIFAAVATKAISSTRNVLACGALFIV
jgi:hypothetical protein